MKHLFLILVLAACSHRNPTTPDPTEIKKMTPKEVVEQGSQTDIFKKARQLIQEQKLKEFTSLINAMPDINIRDNAGNSMLHIASSVEADRAKYVNVVLKRKPQVNIMNKFDYSPLMYAIMEDSNEAVKALLKAGADVNIQDGYGYNALSKAVVWSGNISMIKTIIKYKPDPYPAGPFGKRALQYAKNAEVRKLLESYEKIYKNKF